LEVLSGSSIDVRGDPWASAPLAHLDRDAVHVFRSSVERWDGVEGLRPFMTEAEEDVAELLPAGPERTGFALRRAMPRQIVARELAVAPSSLELEFGQRATTSFAGTGIGFCAAVCDSTVVCAVARGRRVGAAVEALVAYWYLEAFVESCLGRRELDQLAGLDDRARMRAFWRFWVAKDALFAAVEADDATTPLTELELDASSAVRLVAAGGAAAPAEAWSLVEATPSDEHVAVVAVRPAVARASLHEWSPEVT
jgi:4'-phosphopantetheinyl transferase